VETPLTIRPASVADLPAVLGAYLAAGIDEPGETLPPADAAVILSRFQRYPDYTLYIAESEGVFVGSYALLIMDNLGHGGAPSGVVEDVAVLPAWQGRGAGRAMMQHAMAVCGDRGCYKLTLSSNAKRSGAHGFYEHLGFERHGYSFLVPVTVGRPAVEVPAATSSNETTATLPAPSATTQCDVCGGPTYELHCKIICRVCGFTRDCSDP
jgi:GNAT superfamily N-acetyltransferase